MKFIFTLFAILYGFVAYGNDCISTNNKINDLEHKIAHLEFYIKKMEISSKINHLEHKIAHLENQERKYSEDEFNDLENDLNNVNDEIDRIALDDTLNVNDLKISVKNLYDRIFALVHDN